MFTARAGRPSCSEVLPSLLIGAYPTQSDFAWLAEEHGITAVVSLQDDFDLAAKRLSPADVEACCRAVDLVYRRIGIPDGDVALLARELPATVDLLQGLIADGHRVYLHCNAGMNRAPTVAIAYLHVAQGHSIAEATHHVKARRPCVPLIGALRLAYGTGAALRPRRR